MNFRHDINGLRAIAVIAVVLFHFNAAWLPGGFAGVDVFFVISGYLMTAIIFNGLANNNLSIFKFYYARAKRIIPALTVLSASILVFGWFYLYNAEYLELGKHTFSSLLFWSNHTYWLESGYFDAGSHEKWLLHTWSLSAEWQFYLIYPLCIAILAKLISLRWLKILLLITAILSLSLCVIASKYWPDAAYFLLPTRAWQMIVGGLVFLYPLSICKNSKALEVIGLLFIIGSYIFINEYQMWPGYLAALPVLGACLIMQSNNKSIFTGNIVFQKIGLWSYSIYLWHWPIVVFIHNFIDNITIYHQILGIALSILLGFISFHLVEKSTKKALLFSIYFIALLFAYYIFQLGGANNSYRPLAESDVNAFVSKHRNYLERNKTNFTFKCIYANSDNNGRKCYDLSSKGGVFLWGDSHMEAISPGLQRMLPEVKFSRIISSGCPSSFYIKQGDMSKLRRACDKANELALKVIRATKPDTVIIANKDKHELLDWKNTIHTLKAAGVENVVAIGPVPQWYPSLPIIYAKKGIGSKYLSSNKLDKNLVKTNRSMLKLSVELDDLIYVDILNQVCDLAAKPIKCKVIYGDELIAWDYGHLTRNGSLFIAKEYIAPALQLPKINERITEM